MNQAVVKLSGASSAGIKAELFDVLTEFFDVSSCWTEAIDLDALAYQHEYDIETSSGQIIRLNTVIANSNFTTNALYDAAEAIPPSGTNLGTWVPQNAVMPYIGRIILRNPPSNPQAMKAVVVKNVVLPTGRDQVPEIPSWVLQRWHRYILSGVLGNMMGTENKSYTNDAMSVYNMKKFQEGISRARVAALKANTMGGQAWVYPQAFKTRSQNGYLSVGNDTRF